MRFLAIGPDVMERYCRLAGALLLLLFLPIVLRADRVTLKNGTMIEGSSVAIKTMNEQFPSAFDPESKPSSARLLLIDQGFKRYIVPIRQVQEDFDEQQLRSFDFFELSQRKSSSKLNMASIGLPRKITPFDEHGVRTVTLSAPGGRELEIVQGITRITPEFITVEGVNQNWWQGLSTEAFPAAKLSELIHESIDPQDPDDRLAVARFFIQAGRYEPAARELAGIARDFPDLQARISEIERDLNQLRANWLLDQVRQRRAAGQHRLAIQIAKAFPTEQDFDAEILREVESLQQEYRDARERADRILLRLGELEAELDDPLQRQTAAEMRRIMAGRLDWDSLERLDAFTTLADDDSLPAADRLALAYSGWMTGSAAAITDLPQTLRLWDARWQVSEYLRSDNVAREAEILASLASLEAIGPSEIAALIPFLSPWGETPPIAPGRVVTLETKEQVAGWGGAADDGETLLTSNAGPVRYAVTLPPEYSPSRAYPLVVALRPAEWTIEQAVKFWGVRENAQGQPEAGPAAQAGYIVIAPEYAGASQTTFNFSARAHLAIVAAIRDAKRRFMIDSNRVYLAGHGMGGDATFDLALSQPHLFAGAAPISGIFRQEILFEKQSTPRVPFYIVNGELDRNARGTHGDDLAYMMHRGHDMIYCEYVGRGYEHYPAEIDSILAWMGRLERTADPKEFNAQIARTSDNRFYWISAEQIPPRFLVGRVTRKGVVPNPLNLEARISGGNTISIDAPAERYILRLNADLVNLNERVKVRLGSRQHFNEFVEPSAADLLENLKETGDRQRLYPIRLRIE